MAILAPFLARFLTLSSSPIGQTLGMVGLPQWKPVESEKDLRQETLTRQECYSQENLGLNIELSYI